MSCGRVPRVARVARVAEAADESSIKFTINGEEYIITNDVGSDTSLNSFIKTRLNLSGTKTMCFEGGCGACIVSVAALHPVTQIPQFFSVNSCLVSILSCHGWSITTVEGLGNQKDGFHPIQKRLAAFSGTQCGYCSPGWVMSMNSLVADRKDDLTMAEVENSFASNMCRCTGYRPILDAFKTFSNDCDPKLMQQIDDIEELSAIKMCNKSGLICTKSCGDYSPKENCCTINQERPIKEMKLGAKRIELDAPDCKWYKVYVVSDIFDVFDEVGTDSYMLVDGNTAKGIYSAKKTDIMIDVSNVLELKSFTVDGDLVLGGNMTISETMKVCQEISEINEYFKYAAQISKHMDLIAHIPVRNIGSLAGNLMLKHQHNDFQSDIFVIFEAVGATLTIAERDNITSGIKTIDITLLEFLETDMKGRIIQSINLPQISDDNVFHSYKIAPRAQNAHAHVNAGFVLKFDADKKTVLKASIVYNGISPKFNHATATEKLIVGKNIFDKTILQQVLESLSEEIIPEAAPPEPSPIFRKKLAVNLFYKYIIHISPDGVFDETEKSGGDILSRPVSSGHQNYDTNKDVWPLNKPIPKLEALVQCSGEAKYINDLSPLPGELFAAFVLSKIARGNIESFDATDALKTEGVVAFFTAKDIPGVNSFTPMEISPEEVLCSDEVLYYGQPLAMIVAKTSRLASSAAGSVKVVYKNVSTKNPVISVRQALASDDLKDRILPGKTIEPTKERGTDITRVIKGAFDFHGQYHYTMETQVCVCVPIEDGLDVYSSTQWIDVVQDAISKALNIPEHKLNLKVRRLGGAYGAKITRSNHVAVACALAATKLNKPVRFSLSLRSNMAVHGKRLPYATEYEVGVNDEGEIQYLEHTYWADDGCSHNDSANYHALGFFPNCYKIDTWSVKAFSVITDTASNTAARAPGTTEGIAMIENIMEHIAVEIGKDPMDVRVTNMNLEDSAIPELLKDLKESSDFDRRRKEVDEFNKANRWRKRGLSIMPLNYRFQYAGNYSSMISVYHDDGTVAVAHGGIEMGQGLNTKVAQVCAHILGIPLEMVAIKPTDNFTAPNAIVSGGSLASEACCYATIRACQILLARLEPVKKKMVNPTWPELIQNAHYSNVDLCAHYMFSSDDIELKNYSIWAVTATEVEVDLLTGNHQIIRVDILEDTGESLSPLVDVGQVEGAFVMGLGYWTSENLVSDEKTGELLTNRTWNYKIPGAKDIPADFRVSFRRNAPNLSGVLRSKATGEPSLNTSISVVFAIRQAITAARADKGLPTNYWIPMEMPCTVENVLLAAETSVV